MWQTLFGRCIYESPSGYKVYQNPLYRWLTLGSTALQTVINRYNPQKPVLHYLPELTLMARYSPGRSCLLGLGGAGAAHLLGSTYPDQTLVAVEKSNEVIQIAEQFFLTHQLHNLSIIHQSACDFINENKDLYMHIMIDLYDANHYPDECNNDLFFHSCKTSLDKNGFLAVNLANVKEQWPIFQLIKKQFKINLVLPVKKSANMVIISTNNDNKELFFDQIKNTGEIKKIIWESSWGYVGQ